MKWKQLFDHKIIERGEDIYKHNLVHHVENEDGVYKGIISGTHDYHVEMRVNEDGSISYMKCDCPYAKLNRRCKHMAALCCYVENQLDEINKHDVLDTKKDIDELTFKGLLEKLDKNEIIDYLSALCLQDAHFKEAFISLYRDTMSDAPIQKYRHELIRLIDAFEYHLDDDSFDDFMMKMNDFLLDCIESLLSMQKPLLAFRFVNECAFAFVNSDVLLQFDYDNDLFHLIYRMWKKIKHATTFQQDEMKTWFTNQLDEHTHPKLYNSILKFLIYEYRDVYALGIKLDLIAQDIQKQRFMMTLTYDQEEYDLLLEKAYKIVKKLNFSKEELESFEKFPAFISIVRNIRIILYLFDGPMMSATNLLKKNIKEDQSKRYKLLLDYELLIMIYYQIKDREYLKELLATYLIELKQFRLNFIAMFKEICSKEEWMNYRDQILSQCNKSSRFDLLCIDENYEQLLQELKIEDNIDFFNNYLDELIRYFPRDVYHFYHKKLIEMIYKSSSFYQYHQVIRYLHILSSYPHKEEVDLIVDDIYKTFHDRDDLLALLEKEGY